MLKPSTAEVSIDAKGGPRSTRTAPCLGLAQRALPFVPFSL